MVSEFRNLSGMSMFVEASGGTSPALVFLHGVTANYSVWNDVIRALPEDWARLAVDQRGHGRSSRESDNSYRASDYAHDIVSLRRTLNDTVPVFLIGHSLGARNSLTAAAQHPELFAGVVAIDFCPFIETAVLDRLEDRVVGGDRTFESLSDVETYIQDRYPLMPFSAVMRRAEFGYEFSEGKYRALANAEAMRQTVEGLRADLSEDVLGITVPTVMVRGELSTLVSEEAFDKTRALRPDLDYIVVPDADHYVPEEQPQAIASIITRLIENVVALRDERSRPISRSRK
ncbi:MAG: alpha/beta hydrolase [Aurantimicrobium sp.]|jgi:2-(acetamidomethylene)succinate hydrolase|nr:alpha/beta hydrolase [Aurantimicrobium sp.]